MLRQTSFLCDRDRSKHARATYRGGRDEGSDSDNHDLRLIVLLFRSQEGLTKPKSHEQHQNIF